MLADDVGRSEDLEIIQVEYIGHQIGRPEIDAVARIGAKEEGFGWTSATQRDQQIALQQGDARLRIVPPRFVHSQIELQIGRAILAVSRTGLAWLAVRRTRLRRKTVDPEQPGPAR